MLKIGLAATIALALVGAGCGNGRSATTSASGPFEGAAFPAGVHAAGFALPDLSGHTVSLLGQRGHVVVLAFLPGDCRTCLLVAEQIRGALDELASHPPAAANVRTILVSTAPRSTMPARAKAFLSKTSLLGRVSYLTTDQARLRPVLSAYHVTPASAGRTAAEDAITVLLIDRSGLERVGFGIEQITPESLSHDIRLLQAG